MNKKLFTRKPHLLLALLLVLVVLVGVNGNGRSVLTASAQAAPRTAFVHLFEWKWSDIAQECENFLGPAGYSAVQVSPPNEHIVVSGGAWWQRYQPVSYQLVSRSGNRAEFIDMVQRCDAVGVDIYVDAVINHMTGPGSGYGSAGSYYEHSSGYSSYPGVPYGTGDFHTDCEINYGNAWSVQNCELVGLNDLDTGKEYVRDQIAAYMNDLIAIGVAGFRIDASKHINTNDLNAIIGRLNGDPYIFQEVIDQGGEPITAGDYFQNGDVTEFKYSINLGNTFYNGQLAWLDQFGPAWGMMSSDKAVVFTDNHDNQRGHGGGGHVITYKDGQLYDLANIFMLAWPYGYPKVMSSYEFSNGDQGPPADANGNTNSIYVNGAANCFNEWKCEHRWQPIANMVAFRNNTASDFTVNNWWSNGSNQIAFSRDDSGFVTINKEGSSLTRTFQTGLAAGTYCDVIHGNFSNGTCSGPTVEVNSDGTATVTVASWDAVALHVGAKVSNGGGGLAKVYNQVYFRGTANNWAATPMALVANNTWEVTATFSGTAADRFKFDINGDWSLNFGDNNNDGVAEQSGGDIYVTQGAGNYTITFNDSTKAYTITKNGGGTCAPTSVTFNVANATTTWGQQVYVVGNVPELGNWNTANAVLLTADNYPTWSGTVNIAGATAVTYKFIKKDGNGNIIWQSGADRTLTTTCGGTHTTNDNW